MDANFLLNESLPLDMQDGKHLVFQLGEGGYGIPILEVSEINGLMAITPIPKTPKYIKGVINLRGKIIPVMDLRLKFDMPEKEYDERTCIIIVSTSVGSSKKQIGIVVDVVSEVFDIPLSEIEAPPQYGTHCEEDFLNGIGKVKGQVVMLLNIEKVVYSEDIIKLLDRTDSIQKKEGKEWIGLKI